MTQAELVEQLTPDVAAKIDATVAAPGAQNALISGGLGAMLAGPLVKLVLAKLLPVLRIQVLNMLDAEVAKVQAAHPELDLSFVHGLVASLFAALGGMTATGSPTGPSGVSV